MVFPSLYDEVSLMPVPKRSERGGKNERVKVGSLFSLVQYSGTSPLRNVLEQKACGSQTAEQGSSFLVKLRRLKRLDIHPPSWSSFTWPVQSVRGLGRPACPTLQCYPSLDRLSCFFPSFSSNLPFLLASWDGLGIPEEGKRQEHPHIKQFGQGQMEKFPDDCLD